MDETAAEASGSRRRARAPRVSGARGKWIGSALVLLLVLLSFWVAAVAVAATSAPLAVQAQQGSPSVSTSAAPESGVAPTRGAGMRALFALTIIGVLAVIGWRLRVWQRERERARDALAQSEALLKHSLWGSRGELWDADIRTGALVRRNRLEHLEVTRSASVDSLEAYTPFVHEEDLPRFRALLTACIRGSSELFECSYRSPDTEGRWRWLLSRGRVFARDASGHAIRMVGTTFDITELRASEEALRQSEERLKLSLWGSGDELWDIDLATGEIKRENAMPETALSTAVEFRRLLDYLDVVHPDDREALKNSLIGHIKGEIDHFECSYRMRTNDGGWLWILGKGRVVGRGNNGLALRMVGTNRDISRLKLAEEELRGLNEELESRVERRTHALAQANLELTNTLDQLTKAQRQLVESEKLAALGSLVAGVAHEINTPLGVGVTAASHLQAETDTLLRTLSGRQMTRGDLDRYLEQARMSSDLILRNLERASQLVRSFKQVAVDQSSEQRRQFALREYLAEILMSLYPRMKKSRGRVEIICADDILMDTYPGALYQIIVNLVINSLVHAFDPEHGGAIEIRAVADGDDVVIDFRDDGVGMSQEVSERIFEPYFTTRRGSGGSGLGLHIVYNLTTQLLQGRVSCDSSPGKGTHFRLVLPRVVQVQEAAVSGVHA